MDAARLLDGAVDVQQGAQQWHAAGMLLKRIVSAFHAPRRWFAAHRTVAYGAAAVLAIGAIGWLTKLRSTPDTWAALGQWAGALGTVLAVVVALGIAQGEAARARTEERRQQRERELAQARLVTGELTYHDEDDTPPEFNVGDFGDLAVVITNHGPTPILHPRVEGFEPHAEWQLCVYGPTSDLLYGKAPTVQGAGEYDRVPIDLVKPKPRVDEYPLVPIIGYTTADGLRWRRTGAGDPVRVAEDDTFQAGGPDWYRVRESSA